jgi:hypothetical protein
VFNRRKPDQTHELDTAITNLISGFEGLEDGSEEQLRAAQSLKTVMEARTTDKVDSRTPLIDPNVLVSAGASIFSILAILGFEKANVVTSKAVSFVTKPKI